MLGGELRCRLIEVAVQGQIVVGHLVGQGVASGARDRECGREEEAVVWAVVAGVVLGAPRRHQPVSGVTNFA